MKSKRRRKNEKIYLENNSILIMCRYCSEYKNCKFKNRKITNEKRKIRTFCLLTPNKSKKTLIKITSLD